MTQKKITITRDSVSMGDDSLGRVASVIEISDEDRIATILTMIMDMGYLPKISGGKATWSVATNRPLAIIAQEWQEPKLIVPKEFPFQGSRISNYIERLHFNYFAQLDPDVVYQVLSRFRIPEI